ncbi:MAG TPA: beta-ketoacyl-ACP synthase 3 [Solirubrobacteraceae bacterium]|jgi:3-oxoacyl-[acyl-carrier-protein] synthase-3|nr:beta-ketoacyl-ACP synthase 3 [Solirubrobacteraceae bacterium]
MPEPILTATAAPLRTPLPATARDAAILSVSAELPEGVLTTAELALQLDVSEDWILSRTGIRERRRAAPEERLSDFAARAGARALARAGVDAVDVDLVLVATMTPDEVTPNTAPLVAEALGATHAGACDVGAACTGWLSGLGLGAAQIESGRAELVLLVGADFITRITDYEDKRTAPLFADAAGAVVLGTAGASSGGRIGPVVLRCDGSHADTIHATHEDRVLRMDGPEVYRNAIMRMTEVTHDAVARAGLTLDDIDLFVYHQANARITRALGERLGLAPERVVDCIERLGNASAATIPVGLVAAEEDGRLARGTRVLVSAFGAGFTWGGGVIEWSAVRDG